MSSNKKDDEMICALTADEYAALQTGLDELPETMPPRDVWLRIREQAEAEGLLQQPHGRRNWYLGAGIAAAALMAAIILQGTQSNNDPGRVVPQVPTNNVAGLPQSNLVTLRAESQQLERDLRALPDEPRVSQAGTVATIVEIEDRIAAIDYKLNETSETMSIEEREVYWIERVRLMKVLLQLRYAQAQRVAIQ